MRHDAVERRAQLESMALRLAFDVDAQQQRGPDAWPEGLATLLAAADELRRASLALAFELGDADPTVVLARTVLEGFARECGGLTREQERAWAISGSYLEACNCQPMCSCEDGPNRRPRRPPRGVCTGALAWTIERGHAEEVNLDGLSVVLAFRHDPDQPGSPWELAAYLDQRASAQQRSALQSLFTGSGERRPRVPFPWASAAGQLVRTRSAPIHTDHRARRPWLDAGDYVSVRVGDPISPERSATSLILGHDHTGVERRGQRLHVADRPLAFSCNPHRGFHSRFTYVSDPAA